MTRDGEQRPTPPPGAALRPETPSQTAGPYVHIGLAPALAGLPVRDGSAPGERLGRIIGAGRSIEVSGVILDGAAAPVTDALIEVYQRDGAGAPVWGRMATAFADGGFQLETVYPAAAPGADGATQAPHLTLLIFARGLNIHLETRLYFPEAPDLLAIDRLLALVPEARRGTLIAERLGDARYRHCIRLRGEGETVFFDN